ncbi:MAG: hypothetical protein JHD16_16635 [Solirubrobacteraceae bacterium]|nr:hypothetical protein [Solirubrobacteraceae bacterium]
MSRSTSPSAVLRHLSVAGAVVASGVALAPSAAVAASPGGYQYDQFRLAGPGRMVVTVAAPKQVPGLPAATRGYHEYCSTSVSPILRYRIKFSKPGDSSGFFVRAQWARPGSTAYVPFGLSNPGSWDGSTYGAPKTQDQPLTADRFISDPSAQAIPVAPPAALLNLRVIVRTDYWFPLWGEVGYSTLIDQATLATKLEFRVLPSTSCAVPATYPGYFRAR